MKNIKIYFLCFACMASLKAYTQDSKKEKEAAKAEAVKNMVESKNYVFLAETASPMKAGIVHLTSDYSLKVMPDAITCNLPYYGQAHQSSLAPSDGGYKFTSSDFEYTSEVRKKGGWNITIKIKDVKFSPQLLLTIMQNGSTSLSINSNDRQSISYGGEIEMKSEE